MTLNFPICSCAATLPNYGTTCCWFYLGSSTTNVTLWLCVMEWTRPSCLNDWFLTVPQALVPSATADHSQLWSIRASKNCLFTVTSPNGAVPKAISEEMSSQTGNQIHSGDVVKCPPEVEGAESSRRCKQWPTVITQCYWDYALLLLCHS